MEENRRQRAGNSHGAGAQAARFQLAELAAIYERAPVGICVLDRELRYVRINQALAEANGIPAAAHIGQTVREMVPTLAGALEPLLQQVLEQGEAVCNVEIRGEPPGHPGMQRTWLEHFVPVVDEAGTVVGVNVTAVEITDRRQAERALEENQLQLQMALEGAELGLWLIDLRTGEIFWDARLREILGVAANVPASVAASRELVYPDDRERARQRVARATAADSDGRCALELRIVRPDGEVRWLACRGQTYFEGTGEERHPLYLTGVAMDITQQKRAAALLRGQRVVRQAESARRREMAETLQTLEQDVDELLQMASSMAESLRDPTRDEE